MRRAFIKILSYLFVFSMTACGSGSYNNVNTNQTATTPMDLRCINGTTSCPSSTYSSYAGWTNYNFPYTASGYNYLTYFNQNGFCGCPSGYSPSYNSNLGLGCIENALLQPIYNYTVFMGFASSGFTSWSGGSATINIPQVSNIPGSAYSGACVNQISQNCILNQSNSCGIGATCRQVLTGSNLGVCINPYQTSTSTFNTGFQFNYGFGGGMYGRW